ncbi:MAG: aminodeoxychorismate synthase component I [Flavobacteriaceae bacterium]|nr:aminodeoxychorismate synthase component I [Flavobacteriaceae bacterium]
MNWIETLNHFGNTGRACAFFISFDKSQTEIFPLESLYENDILIEFPHFNNHQQKADLQSIKLISRPVSFEKYQLSFHKVMHHLQRGDSYLVNLTFQTPIDVNSDLFTLFIQSKAKYKIKYQNNWICFSPETFIQINENQINTYPMKGTIDANIPNAEEILKNNFKEKAEHHTIVDLLRNDLSMRAKHVQVKKLMYLEKISSLQGEIWQMSSEITGILPKNWPSFLGNLLNEMLPAGSISGAPKLKTLQIIQEVENYSRGFYTGIAGVFDGKTLDTCVLIRFIEKTSTGLVYKSGGGITAMSQAENEYQELIQKIYVPVY